MKPSPLALLVLAGAACGDPHKIILSVDTTAGIPCDLDTIRVRATASSTATYEQELAGERLPLTITLEDDTSNGGFDLEVSGLKGGTEVLRAAGPLQFGVGDTLAARVVLESSCTPETPCQLPELVPYTAPPAPVTARFECGPIVRRYKPGPTVEVFFDACSVPGTNTGRVLANGARGAAQLPLSAAALENFGFRYYSRPIRQIWAHEDGYLSFSPNNPDALNDLDPGPFDRDLLGTGVPPPPQSAMGFWDGLNLSPTGICYALEGQPGTQKLRVTWSRACHTLTCPADGINFTIVLDERNQRVAFTYGSMNAASPERAQGASATVGLVNAATGCRVSECTLDTGLCADGVTPCGYSQVFSNTPQMPKIQNIQFDPIVDPD